MKKINQHFFYFLVFCICLSCSNKTITVKFLKKSLLNNNNEEIETLSSTFSKETIKDGSFKKTSYNKNNEKYEAKPYTISEENKNKIERDNISTNHKKNKPNKLSYSTLEKEIMSRPQLFRKTLNLVKLYIQYNYEYTLDNYIIILIGSYYKSKTNILDHSKLNNIKNLLGNKYFNNSDRIRKNKIYFFLDEIVFYAKAIINLYKYLIQQNCILNYVNNEQNIKIYAIKNFIYLINMPQNGENLRFVIKTIRTKLLIENLKEIKEIITKKSKYIKREEYRKEFSIYWCNPLVGYCLKDLSDNPILSPIEDILRYLTTSLFLIKDYKLKNVSKKIIYNGAV